MDVDPTADQYDTLLPGESNAIKSGRTDEIDLWIEVYTELISFKEKLLHEIAEQRQNVRQEGQLEIGHDETIIQREHARLARRRAYWQSQKDRNLSG